MLFVKKKIFLNNNLTIQNQLVCSLFSKRCYGIFQNLIQWLNNDWQFKNLAFANNPNTTHQAELFEKNGLQFYLSLTDKNRYQNLWIIKGK